MINASEALPSFRARTTTGAGRGKGLGIPTVNLELDDVPSGFAEGIYGCRVTLDDGRELIGAMHYGPRPVFKDSVACEIHLLDAALDSLPPFIDVTIIRRVREVRNFPSPEAMMKEIEKDIAAIRTMAITL